jgi:L-methionine (R)-S-oxide reductase
MMWEKGMDKEKQYQTLLAAIESLIEGETDAIAIMATMVGELHNTVAYFDWTGFYRVTEPRLLTIGPYQGTHGCLRIPFEKGVCGACARTGKTQRVPDVHQFPGHIACSSTTASEIVVPVFNPKGELAAVLDIDSNTPDAFDEVDQRYLEQCCELLGSRM